MGSVRYGMRLGAVSPPPPGAGPRYRSQCCWPSTATAAPGPVSRIPLLATAPINSFDIISCANRVRITEDATSELPQQATVRDHVLYSTKCLFKSQLKRCALVRPKVYARLCEYGPEEDILNTLDRLPRFRFGGNRASTNKGRDFDKRAAEQRMRELAERLKRGPVPPPRTRHPARTPPISPKQPEPPLEEAVRVTPLRSVSFSQVDYSSNDKKYVRRRQPSVHNEEPTDNHNAATLPRSKNLPRSPISNLKLTNQESASTSPVETNNLNQLLDMITQKDTSNEETLPETNSEKDAETQAIVRPTSDTPNIQEKKRDKSRRRKGIYISHWPNAYPSTEDAIPQFAEETDSETKLLQDSIAEIGKLQISDEKNPTWSTPQDEQTSSEENNMASEWPPYVRPRLSSQSPEERDNSLRITAKSMHLLRSDSLSEGEPDMADRKLDQQFLVPSDVSDCESRVSLGNDSISPCIPRRYSKRPLRGPYGQMLEAEMKKPETGRKNQLNNDLKFLEDLSLHSRDPKAKHPRSHTSCNITLDETASKGSCNSLLCTPRQIPLLSKRKVSAESLIVGNENDQRLVVSHQRTTSSPSKLEGFTNTEVSHELLEQLLRGSSEQLAASDANLQLKNDTRTHVVVELYDNERSYVESLQILKYLEPLRSPENSNLLDLTLVDEIFYQIPTLLNLHQMLLEEMKKRLEHWDLKQKIGDVFLEMFSKAVVIETYTNYVNNWKRARDIIKNAQQSKPAFARFLENAAREHKGKLALDSLLIKPIQKFPKYELLLQRLIKHTDINHPDHSLLIAAQREVHDQLLKINCTERETLELEQLREIESLIEGLEELVSADRQYLRHDLVSMAAGGGTRKERALFLFSDLLLVTSIKRRSGTIRRPTTGQQGSVTSTLEANKYKLLMKIALEDLEILRSKDDNLRQMMIEIENLTSDVKILNQINEMSLSLHCNHTQLDDLLRDMLSSLNKQLMEQQNSDSQLSCLDLTLNTSTDLENISIAFSKPEKRASWEESFNEAKQKLAISGDRRPCPELVATVPIRKTRAGLQFTCAAPTLGDTGKDVWVCNSDGYVGQVCIFSLQPEPTVTSCNGVCNARILCIASVPGVSNSNSINRGNHSREDNAEYKTIQFDSSSSSDEDDKSENEEADEAQKVVDQAEVSSLDLDDIDSQQSTIWLGTEDGCIHVYNSSDNIRIKKNKIRLQHGSSILCIIYLENRVFISLANGDITIYDRDNCGWNINAPTTVTVGSTCMPVSKMLPNGGKLWCGCGSTVKVFNTQTYATENTFTVNNDSNKPVSCMVLSGNGLWLSLQNSAIVKCFHTSNFELLCEVNVAPVVTKMLTSCDDIIRQHKAACLRVTSLLACKDLLWIGTSAGVLLTMPLPHITSSTTKLSNVPTVTGVSHGHTGHVRFLAYVELTSESTGDGQKHRNSYKGKPEQRTNSKLLVISGGDGYEDFRSSNVSEVAGREDSTNHLLLWNI